MPIGRKPEKPKIRKDSNPDEPSNPQEFGGEEEKRQQIDRAKYNALITDAEKLFDSEEWELAKEKYQKALNIDGTQDHPKNRVEECDAKINEEENIGDDDTGDNWDDEIVEDESDDDDTGDDWGDEIVEDEPDDDDTGHDWGDEIVEDEPDDDDTGHDWGDEIVEDEPENGRGNELPPEPDWGSDGPEEITEPEEEVVNIPYDPESSYFFMFGVASSGKTVVLSGLFYNLLTAWMGSTLKRLNDKNIDHQRKGMVLMDELITTIPKGAWPKSTATQEAESNPIPRQINLEFAPGDMNKPEFKFSVMDFAGEDLQRIKVHNDDDKLTLPKGIELFLSLPENNLAYVCVFPAESGTDDTILSSYQQNFMYELDRIGHHSTPLILLISKWDVVEDQYDTAAEFLQDRAPIIWQMLNQPERNVSLMKFSIGDVDETEETYKYQPEHSEKLFEWMYKTQMGESPRGTSSESGGGIWDKLFGKKGK